MNFTDPTGMVRDWVALGRDTIGVIGSGVGFGASMTTFGAGVVALAAPEPTMLSKAGGIGLMGLGYAGMAFSMDSMRQNVNAIMSNILETPELSSPGLKEDIINPNNPVASGLYDATSLATGLATGQAAKGLLDLPKAVDVVADMDTAIEAGQSIEKSATAIATHSSSHRSDQGMSGGNVHICSGMGAQKSCP